MREVQYLQGFPRECIFFWKKFLSAEYNAEDLKGW